MLLLRAIIRKLRRGQHPCRDGDSIPSVDHRDRPHQLSEFVLLEVRARLLPDLTRYVLIANQSDCVGKCERCAFKAPCLTMGYEPRGDERAEVIALAKAVGAEAYEDGLSSLS